MDRPEPICHLNFFEVGGIIKEKYKTELNRKTKVRVKQGRQSKLYYTTNLSDAKA